MYWDVIYVKPVAYLELVVKFLDGLEGVIKIKSSYLTGVFEPLKDKEYFNQVYLYPLPIILRILPFKFINHQRRKNSLNSWLFASFFLVSDLKLCD